jgi:hypothetical protein
LSIGDEIVIWCRIQCRFGCRLLVLFLFFVFVLVLFWFWFFVFVCSNNERFSCRIIPLHLPNVFFFSTAAYSCLLLANFSSALLLFQRRFSSCLFHSSQLRLIPYLHWGSEADSPEVCRLLSTVCQLSKWCLLVCFNKESTHLLNNAIGTRNGIINYHNVFVTTR